MRENTKKESNLKITTRHIPAQIPSDCIHIRHLRSMHRPCQNKDKTHRKFKAESYVEQRDKTSLCLI